MHVNINCTNNAKQKHIQLRITLNFKATCKLFHWGGGGGDGNLCYGMTYKSFPL